MRDPHSQEGSLQEEWEQLPELPDELPLDRATVIVGHGETRHELRRFLALRGLRQPLRYGIFWADPQGEDAIVEVELPDLTMRHAWPLLGSTPPDDEFHVIWMRERATLFTRASEIDRLHEVFAASGPLVRFTATRATREWMDGRALRATLECERSAPSPPCDAWVLVVPAPPENRALIAAVHAAFDRALDRCCDAWAESGGYRPTPDIRLQLALDLVDAHVEGLVEGPLPPGSRLEGSWQLTRRRLPSLVFSRYEVPVGDDRVAYLVEIEVDGASARVS